MIYVPIFLGISMKIINCAEALVIEISESRIVMREGVFGGFLFASLVDCYPSIKDKEVKTVFVNVLEKIMVIQNQFDTFNL